MILSSILLAFSAMSLAYVNGASEESTANQVLSADHRDYTSRLQIGGNYTHVHLEPQGGPSSNGNMGGMQGLYEYWAKSHFYAGAKLTWSQGTLNESGGRSLLYIDAQERLGASVCLDAMKARWTFFSGLGYRHLSQDFNQASSLRFEYNEFYVPVGWNMDYAFSSWFHWNINGVWMPQIFPSLWIHPYGGANWSVVKQLGNFLVEMPLEFTLNRKGSWHILVTPFYEYWQNGKTTAATSWGLDLGIPRNTYQFCGLNVNVAYCF